MSAIHASRLPFFAARAPFDHMERSHLIWMLERMKLGYYAEGEVIVPPEQSAVNRFLVVKHAQSTSPISPVCMIWKMRGAG